MNSTLPSSLDQLWNSAASPMWLTLAAAAFFAVIVLITLVRAERSVANGALTVITLLAVGIAVAATIRGFDPSGRAATADTHEAASAAGLPALACIDDMAGDLVLSSCEKTLFGSAESTAAAVGYAAAMISRLTAIGDVATANKTMTPELLALRKAVERDRYGLMAYVLLVRDRCTPSDCVAFRSVTDRQQIVNNMEGRTYEGLVTRYASQWGAQQQQQQSQSAAGQVAGLAPSMPTGKPTNADFPSAASTPPVSIMTPEPTASTRSLTPPSGAAAQPAAPRSPSPSVAASHAQVPPARRLAPPRVKPPTVIPQVAPEPAEPPATQ